MSPSGERLWKRAERMRIAFDTMRAVRLALDAERRGTQAHAEGDSARPMGLTHAAGYNSAMRGLQ